MVKEAPVIILQFMEKLFPDGNIPSENDILDKIRKGNYTVRDSLIYKLYQEGVQFGYGDKFTDPDAVKVLETKFGTGSGGPQVFEIATTLERADALDKPYFEFFGVSPAESEAKTGTKGIRKTHQNLDNITALAYSEAGKKMPRSPITTGYKEKAKTKKIKTKAEMGRYPPIKTIWESVTKAASKMPKNISTAFIFHNTNPMRIEDLLGFTVDPEVSQRGTKGVSRPLLQKLPTGEFELTLPANPVGREKKYFNSFILNELQTNMVESLYEDAMKEYQEKMNYLSKKGNTIESYNAEYKNKIKYPNGQIFGNISKKAYNDAVVNNLGPILNKYSSVVTGVNGAAIVRKIQSDTLIKLYGKEAAQLFLGHKLASKDVIDKHYRSQGLVRDPLATKHAANDVINMYTSKYTNTIGQLLNLKDGFKILSLSNANISNNKINLDINPEKNQSTGKIIKKTEEEIRLDQKEREAQTKKNIAQLKKETVETGLDTTAKEKLLIQQQEDLKQTKQQILEQTPAKVDDAKVDSKMRKKLDDIEKAGGSWKDLFKKGGGKLGLITGIGTGIGTGVGLTMFSKDARAGDVISAIAPIGMEPSYIGGRGQGLKYPGTDNILTGEEEQLLRERNPELYEQMELAFKRDQAYEQEQEKIKKEFKKEEQAKEMNRLFSEPLMP
tara:strand:- start:2781 stop:4787 length:2007 start_codon:yes stop_codon:yes gene_type:complete